jgi:hypothetical protein
MKKAYNESKIITHGLSIEIISKFLGMQIIKEILLKLLGKKEPQIRDMKFIFEIFLKGIYGNSQADSIRG